MKNVNIHIADKNELSFNYSVKSSLVLLQQSW